MLVIVSFTFSQCQHKFFLTIHRYGTWCSYCTRYGT
ncbi:unnamed protein product [Brassica rapa subsp. trilocularis]